MYKATLRKISNNHNALHTDEVVGEILQLPEKGMPIILYAESLDPTKDIRMIATTPIIEIARDKEVFHIATKNSRYILTIDIMEQIQGYTE